MAARWARTQTLWGVVKNPQRMCPECRALVDRGESLCPMCGVAMREVSRGVLGRSLDLALPDAGRVTFLLIATNVLLYLLTWRAAVRAAGGGFSLGSLLGSVDGYTLVQFGAKYGPFISDGDWWRLVAPIFLHGGALHLAMNSWVLFDLGPVVEKLYGRQKFLVIYVLCGVAGALMSCLWSPLSVSIGASGATFGLIGVMISRGLPGGRRGRATRDATRGMFVRWAIYMLLFGLMVPGIDNAAHIGGLAGGLLFGLLISDTPATSRLGSLRWKLLQAAMVVLVALSYLMVRIFPRV